MMRFMQGKFFPPKQSVLSCVTGLFAVTQSNITHCHVFDIPVAYRRQEQREVDGKQECACTNT